MKKLLALLLALCLMLTLLVACGDEDDPDSDILPPIGGNENEDSLPPANNDNSGEDIDWDLI